MYPERLPEIQRALAEDGLDAWLFYDFRGSDPIGPELNVFVDESDIVVTGLPVQTAVVAILGDAPGLDT